MDLDLVLPGQPNLLEELADVLPLVSLELNDLSVLRMFHYGSIAGKFLLDNFDDLLEVEFRRHSLHSCQRFSTVTLLNTNVDVTILSRTAFDCAFVLGEWVARLKVLDDGVSHAIDVNGKAEKNFIRF